MEMVDLLLTRRHNIVVLNCCSQTRIRLLVKLCWFFHDQLHLRKAKCWRPTIDPVADFVVAAVMHLLLLLLRRAITVTAMQ
jgi:hypothetical protein